MSRAEGLPEGATARVVTVSDRSHGGEMHDRSGPALADGLRALGFEVGDVVVVPDEVPTTILSRGVAGVAGRTFVLNLPGSTGAVRDGVAVLAPVVGHLVAQLRGGGDH